MVEVEEKVATGIAKEILMDTTTTQYETVSSKYVRKQNEVSAITKEREEERQQL